MAQLIVRNLDPNLVRKLKMRAARNERSAEAEHRAILETVLQPDEEGFWKRAAELRAETAGRAGSDTADLLRRDRDRDHTGGGT